MKPALVILAGGASTRLGQCKALAQLGGRSVIERLVAAGQEVDDGACLVVAGRHHAELAAALPPGCELVENPDWRAGRSGSVLCAAARRPGRALLLAPVDVPLVGREVFSALARRWEELGDPVLGWLAPRLSSSDPALDGRHGHPVVVGSALLGLLGGLGPDSPLRDLRRRAHLLASLEVFEPEILDDLDGPEDLARLEKRLVRSP